ncbi:hypothetical protein ACFW3E_00730, partial [Streptomyces sp. NPDC058861]
PAPYGAGHSASVGVVAGTRQRGCGVVHVGAGVRDLLGADAVGGQGRGRGGGADVGAAGGRGTGVAVSWGRVEEGVELGEAGGDGDQGGGGDAGGEQDDVEDQDGDEGDEVGPFVVMRV